MTSLRLAVLAVLFAVAAPPVAAPAAAPAGSPAIRIVVHIPLALNDHTPVEPTLVRDYVRSLATLGPIVEHVGRGSYADGSQRVVFDPIDHVVVTSTWPWAGAVVRKVLVRMRRDLRQDATLAEAVPDPGTWRGEEHRTQFEILAAPPHKACRSVCVELHRLLDVQGGGASEYADDRDGTHVVSSVPKARSAYVRATLRRMRVRFAERPAAFVLVTSS